jgi:N6-L-threonylcarbamoyladenine synthase
MVYIVNKDNQPLMPTHRHGKVRRLLEAGEARVIKKEPFTIQLLYDTTSYVQDLTLGVDAGSKTIGLSVSSESEEVYASEVILRNDIVTLLATRRESRRTRRNRLRYRKPRFNNRVGSKNKGWLAPSIEHKIQTHLRAVDDVTAILPISKIVVETASFDIQKIRNPDISGAEYQEGDQLGFWNVREYVFFRDNHKCQHCKSKSKDPVLNVHHIKSRKTGGNSPGNLITLCKTCHDAYHAGKIELNLKRHKAYRDAAFMGIMRWAFFNKLKENYLAIPVINTYGYITKNTRIKAGLPKEHAIDALCIASHPAAKLTKNFFVQKKIRCHNRQIHKANILKGGKLKRNQAPYKVHGFRLFDKVLYKGKVGFITGRRSSGYFALKTINGEKISNSAKHKELTLIECRKTIIVQGGERAIPSTTYAA